LLLDGDRSTRRGRAAADHRAARRARPAPLDADAARLDRRPGAAAGRARRVSRAPRRRADHHAARRDRPRRRGPDHRSRDHGRLRRRADEVMNMQLPEHPGVHLSYCSNIHPGEDWSSTRANVLEHFAAVGRRIAPEQPFGVGLRLSALALEQLAASPGELERFAAALADANRYVFTINGFPHGHFHERPVKQQVYRPDWSEPERLRYTLGLANTLATLLPEGVAGSISTVPGAFRADGWPRERRSAIAEQLLRAAAGLWAIAEREGKRICLA